MRPQPMPSLQSPHGGRLFTAGGFELEVTIFEDGVPPSSSSTPRLTASRCRQLKLQSS